MAAGNEGRRPTVWGAFLHFLPGVAVGAPHRQLFSGEGRDYGRQERTEGVAPVADGVLFLGTELRAAAVQAAWLQDRGVAEAARPARLPQEGSFQLPVLDNFPAAVGRGSGHRERRGAD